MGRFQDPSVFSLGNRSDELLPSWVLPLVRDDRQGEGHDTTFLNGWDVQVLESPLKSKVSKDTLFLSGFKFERITRLFSPLLKLGELTSLRAISDDLLTDCICAMRQVLAAYVMGDSPPVGCDEMWSILVNRENVTLAVWFSAKDQEEDFAAAQHPIIKLVIALVNHSGGKRPFISTGGFLGVGTANIASSDLIVYLPSTKCPLVLRAAAEGQWYTISGFAHVCGLMGARALAEYVELLGLEQETFERR